MTIAETARKYEITADTLRYYERIGLVPMVTRTRSGIRNYSEEDCRWVEFAKCMRGAGLSIESLVEYVALFQRGDSTREARKQILVEQRDRLGVKISEMQSTFRRLNDKIERYEQTIMAAENKLNS